MQCIEVVRRRFERARVELFRLAHASLPVQGECLLQGLRDVEGPLLHGSAIAQTVLASQCDELPIASLRLPLFLNENKYRCSGLVHGAATSGEVGKLFRPSGPRSGTCPKTCR